MQFTVEQIKEALRKKGYRFYDKANKLFDLNIIAVRKNKGVVNAFDDELYVIYRTVDFRLKADCYNITTEPGLYWLNNPENKEGTAILVPGQYISAYKVGLHRGEYRALVQQKPVKVYRDNDRDNEFDMCADNVQEGVFGINIHKSNPYNQSYMVDKWSAGCQVFQNANEFNLFMSHCAAAAKAYGNSFTYTLLEEADL